MSEIIAELLKVIIPSKIDAIYSDSYKLLRLKIFTSYYSENPLLIIHIPDDMLKSAGLSLDTSDFVEVKEEKSENPLVR